MMWSSTNDWHRNDWANSSGILVWRAQRGAYCSAPHIRRGAGAVWFGMSVPRGVSAGRQRMTVLKKPPQVMALILLNGNKQ